MADPALQKRLFGQQDSRGPVGMLARGKNVYNGASMAAHSGGGPQFGRPRSVNSQQENVQPNFRQGSNLAELLSQGPQDMNPQPINLMSAIQRRLGGRSGL